MGEALAWPLLSERMRRLGVVSRAVGQLVFRFRDYLGALALLILLASARPGDFVVTAPASRLLVAIGLVLLLAGQLTRIAVAGYEVVRRAGVDKRISASRLLTGGLYAHTRNPLYLANIMILAGLAGIFRSRWVLLLGLPAVVAVIAAIVAAEEEFLARKFGDHYAQYRGAVNRFLPRIRGLLATLRHTTFDFRRAIRREYGTVFAVVSTGLLLVARRRLALGGLQAARENVSELAVIWVACALGWALVRWLKKTRRLETIPDDLEHTSCDEIGDDAAHRIA